MSGANSDGYHIFFGHELGLQGELGKGRKAYNWCYKSLWTMLDSQHNSILDNLGPIIGGVS